MKARRRRPSDPFRVSTAGTRHAAIRNRLVPLAHGTCCPSCGVIMDMHLPRGADAKPELDHIHPRSRGGPSIEENYVVRCGKCNRAKRDKLDWEGPRADPSAPVDAQALDW